MSVNDLDGLIRLCDWSTLSVRFTLSRNRELPDALRIGSRVLFQYFNVILVVNGQGGSDKPDELDATGFTRFLHGNDVRHHIQNFLRGFVRLTEEAPNPFFRAMVRLLRKSSWLGWRCQHCMAWVQMMRDLNQQCTEQDPYSLDQSILSVEEWIRLSTTPCAGVKRDPVGCEQYRETIMTAGKAVQDEFAKVCQYTKVKKTRDAVFEQCCRILASNEGARSMSLSLKSWLMENLRFIPFSQISFDRLCHYLILFRCHGNQEDPCGKGIHDFIRENPMMDIRLLFDVGCIFLEQNDQALLSRRHGSAPSWHVLDQETQRFEDLGCAVFEDMCQYHPMYRVVKCG